MCIKPFEGSFPLLSSVLKMGGAGDPPAPVGDVRVWRSAPVLGRRSEARASVVRTIRPAGPCQRRCSRGRPHSAKHIFGDPPTGTAASNVAKRPCPLALTVAPVPSGESPDGTGGSPVLPANHFPNTLRGHQRESEAFVRPKSRSETAAKLFPETTLARLSAVRVAIRSVEKTIVAKS